MTLMVMNSRFCNQNQDSLSFYQEFESSHRLKQQEQHHPHLSESLTCGSQNGFWSPNGQAGHHINSEYFMKSNFHIFFICLFLGKAKYQDLCKYGSKSIDIGLATPLFGLVWLTLKLMILLGLDSLLRKAVPQVVFHCIKVKKAFTLDQSCNILLICNLIFKTLLFMECFPIQLAIITTAI